VPGIVAPGLFKPTGFELVCASAIKINECIIIITVTNKRCRLSPEMVNILVTLKENSELIDWGVVRNGKEEK
jgi:hypothetical protein